MGNANVRGSNEKSPERQPADNARRFRALAKRLRERTGTRPQTSSQELIREDRDRGHRDV